MKRSAWLLTATMACAVLLMGCVESWELVITALLACATFVMTSFAAPPMQPRLEARLLQWLAIGLVGVTAIQCIPLPSSLVARLAPHTALIWERSMHAFGEPGPAWCTLSLDPLATRVEVLKGITYLACFSTAIIIARERHGARFLIRTLIGLSTLVALVALAHEALGLQRVWGVYQPKTSISSISPLMNANQLSGFCAIGLLCAAGSTVCASPVMSRPVSAAIVVGLVGFETWLASRGALGAIVLGLAIVAWFSIGARRGGNTMLSTKWGIPLVVAVAGVAMMIIASSEQAKAGIQERDISKLVVARLALTQMAPSYALFGTGRGAFQSTFPEFTNQFGYFVFTHPENFVAEWVTGWGIPIAVLAFAVIAYALRPGAVAQPSKAGIGVYAALAALALQSLVDFGSETPGLMVSLAVCAGIIVSGERVGERNARRQNKPLAIGLALAGIGVSILVFVHRQDELAPEEDAVARLLRANAAPDDVMAKLHRARSLHPAEPYFPYAAAVVASKQPKGNVPLWAGSALERAPIYGPAHLVLARWLRIRSPSQARLEYRLAQEQGLPFPVANTEVEGLAHDYASAIDLAVAGAAGVPLLNYFVIALRQKLPASVSMIDGEIVRRAPADRDVATRAANAAWSDIEQADAAPWCGRSAECIARAEQAARRVQQLAPDTCDGYAIEARVMVATGRTADGLRKLQQDLDHVTDWPGCDATLASLAISAGQDSMASAAIDALAKHPCAREEDCVSNLLSAASLESTRNSPHRALVYLRRAKEIAPGREDVQKAFNSTSTQVGSQDHSIN